MTSPFLANDIAREEGCRLTAYPDPVSGGAPWTIGYGHTGREVHPGLVWSQAQADGALASDIAAICAGLDTALPWWRTLSDIRQDVLADMAFNMGVHGLIGFTTFLGLVRRGDYADAAQDLGGTLWAKQTGTRAVRLADQMSSGVHQTGP